MKRCLAETKQKKNVQNPDVTGSLLFEINMEGNFLVVQITQKGNVGILDHCEGE
jgi:hypothetical protein